MMGNEVKTLLNICRRASFSFHDNIQLVLDYGFYEIKYRKCTVYTAFVHMGSVDQTAMGWVKATNPYLFTTSKIVVGRYSSALR